MSARLNIGLIGSGFMGQAHADAYRRAAMFYPDLPKRPHLYALADQDQAMAERHAAKLGAEKAYGDWRELVNDPQVDGHCCKVSDEAAFCLIQRPYISKTLL
ncbi:Gfo/Idh/MocA family oxidoreductase, partial [Klebsiella pneumoniae]